MIGSLVNATAIVVGTALGCMLRKGLPERLRTTVMQGLALCVMLIGVQGAIQTKDTMAVILSMVAGGLAGSLVNIELRLEKMGQRAQKLLTKNGGEGSNIATGFVTASLVYCVGAMAIVGSLDSGLRGDHGTLFAKSALDGISSIVFASTMGVGVGLSALAVLLYQGAITLLAGGLEPLLTAAVVTEMSAVGGLLILGIGMNMMFNKGIKVGNLLPAVFMPILYYLVIG